MQEIKNERKEVQDPGALNQITATGFTSVQGFIEEPYAEYSHEEKIGLYFKMRRDPIVSTSLELMKNPILTAPYKWKAKQLMTDNTKNIIDYLEWTYQNLWNGFYAFKRHWSMKFDFGLCLFEPVFDTTAKYKGFPTWQLKKMSPIMLDSVFRYWYDDFGNFLGIQQRWRGTNSAQMKLVDVWLEKLWYDNNNEEFGNILGNSVLESIIPYYLMKTRVLKADVRLRERGTGIAVGKVDKDLSPAAVAQFEKALQTIGNSNGAYFKELIDNSGGTEKTLAAVRFESVQGENTNLAAIESYNKAIFYNTQTQFALSGVTDTGSRAAAESQKSPFIARVNQELKLWDERIDDLNELIIQYSPFANVPKAEWPELISDQIGMAEVGVASQNAVETAQKLSIAVDKKQLESIFGKQTIQLSAKTAEYKGYQFSNKATDEAQKIFSLKLAVDTSDGVRQKADDLINDIYNKAIIQLSESIAKNPQAEIKLPRFSELEVKLKRLADEAFQSGAQSMKDEIYRLGKTQLDSDPSMPLISVTINDEIHEKISALWQNTVNAITQFLKTHNEESLKNLGGVAKAIEDSFLDQRITDRNVLSGVVSGAFTAGRSSVMLMTKAERQIDEYEYTSVLDKKLCENCGGFDGQRATLDEWQTAGMNISPQATSLNPNCYGLKGANPCRCHLIPVTIK